MRQSGADGQGGRRNARRRRSAGGAAVQPRRRCAARADSGAGNAGLRRRRRLVRRPEPIPGSPCRPVGRPAIRRHSAPDEPEFSERIFTRILTIPAILQDGGGAGIRVWIAARNPHRACPGPRPPTPRRAVRALHGAVAARSANARGIMGNSAGLQPSASRPTAPGTCRRRDAP